MRFLIYLVCLQLIVCAFAEMKSASDALNKFSFEILSETIKEQENQPNIVLGPYTVWVALSILTEGAKGKSAEELQEILEIPHQDLQRQQFRDLQKDIIKNIMQDSDGLTLDAINNIFTKKEAKINPQYQELVSSIYGVMVQSLDFKNNPSGSANYINEVISNVTRGRIAHIVDSDSVKTAELYITSALYFKGLWKLPFTKIDEKKPFHNEYGKVISNVPMMTIKEEFRHGEILNRKAHAVQLPYKGDRLSMIVILPKEDPLSSILPAISAISIKDVIDNLQVRGDVLLKMPKFKITTDLKLNTVLKNMGIRDIFTQNANLQGMSLDPLFVSDVAHKAEIEVDEEGTVASAVTAIKIVPLSFRFPTVLEVNKPFLYMVYDKLTQSILFMGKISDPAAV